MFKEHYLKSNSGQRSLNGLVQVLITSLITYRQEHLERENLKFSSEYRLYYDTVPTFLNNRPQSVARHIMNNIIATVDLGQESIMSSPHDATSYVKSATDQ